MTKCPPNYKNLDEIQSFSEQRYATVQWAEQNCQNDEYLKQKTDELEYSSPARIRKRFKPVLVDDSKSYGYTVNPDKTVSFSELINSTFTIDFIDMSMIDLERSDCAFKNFVDENQVQHKCATIPKKKSSVSIKNCRTLVPGEGINSWWYIGFDKTKHYHVRPDWIKNYFDSEIPAVCRAQTFTIPEKREDGEYIEDAILYSVDLNLENNGTTNSNWGSPLIVQLWKTKRVMVEKTKWDNDAKKNVPYDPPQYEPIWYPDGTPETALATAVYQPDRIQPHLQNFQFDKKTVVQKNEHYAIVMLSPLSHWDHCPRVGGWGRNCEVDKYPGGDAFLSEDNCRTWQRYGKFDTTIHQYTMGEYMPQDFGFVVHMGMFDSGFAKDEDFYMYLKPIHMNPIKHIQLVPVGYGDEVQEANLELEFQVSKSGKANSWVTLESNDLSISFNRDPATGEYPHFAFIRVKMCTDDKDIAPYLDSLKVIVDMDIPKEMYVRTLQYNPKITPMLGASAWSKFYSKFEVDESPQIRGSCELITDKICTEHFDIITANELPFYTHIPGLDASKMTDQSMDVRYNYLMNDANALTILKQNKVYVKPYTYTSGGQSVTHPMSFTDGIQFDNSPAYPILDGNLNPMGNGLEVPISEWIDYVFDYDNDKLIFNEVMNQYTKNGSTVTEGIEEYLPVGTLEVSYNPIFIQDLTAKQVGIREDSEGFVLDYFKEEHVINQSDVENRYIQLQFPPCDPLRELVIDDVEYIEDIHFTVDYDNYRVMFPVIDVEQSSTLLTENFEKDMHIVYTPNLEDAGLSIGYRGIRENTDKQMIIYDNYLEYKV